MKIAFIAHDTKKNLMQNLCIAYRDILAGHELYATGATGRLIEDATDLNVHKLLSGHLGGVQQVAAEIEQNDIDMVFFLRDPVTKNVNDPNPANILRLCDTHNIPVATNLATAEMLVKALERGDLDWREAYR